MSVLPFTAARRAACRALACILGCVGISLAAAADERPNFLLILADDMGFSDVGAFGGEIATPHLDQLAASGLRMSNFHATPTCSPTRAELLTGVDHHLAGLANMAELITDAQRGKPGYLGYLDEGVLTVAERLSAAGYRTVMSGKWHLGKQAQQDPHRRGFESAFALLEGGHNHFGKPGMPPASLGGANYTENGEPVGIPEQFYSSDYFTDKLLAFLDEGDGRPFFAYLPFTAPHWPLHAPAANTAKYRGRYDAGWEVLRAQRVAKQAELGLLAANAPVQSPQTLRDWDSLGPDQQREQARKMEIYAGMVDRMDWNIGRVVDYLKQTGQFDNTVIIFLSDNGAAPDTLENMARKVPDFPPIDPGAVKDWGGPDSLLSYGPNWAQAATAPRRLYKSVVAEGGLISPLIIHYGGWPRGGEISNTFANARDIAPTLLEMAGVQVAEASGDRLVVRGRSMLPYLAGERQRVHGADDVFGWELFGQRAIRKNQWKLMFVSSPNGSGEWALYNLDEDPGETLDLSRRHPDVFNELLSWWEEYQRRMQIVLEEQVVSPYTAM
ncbi:arylsulfatase [Parahaliea mediterranea]|uniref:Arylsulfatase n=1 Tax=Parahaliea mediterranea TaxID=651086 RepID=A0A939DC63_9GAMM|nr:arylsulfatase [Parahaliea mediterranea]MBN7795533.1 arylsulfatase [Parahaliea mediterranea]